MQVKNLVSQLIQKIIENNLKESSLVSQRMVYNGIMKAGGIMKIDISNEIFDFVGRLHRLYQVVQKESKENQTLFEKKRLKRKR